MKFLLKESIFELFDKETANLSSPSLLLNSMIFSSLNLVDKNSKSQIKKLFSFKDNFKKI